MSGDARYEVTGVEVTGQRFKITTDNRMHAFAINLWRGTVWERDPRTGRRRVIKRVFN